MRIQVRPSLSDLANLVAFGTVLLYIFSVESRSILYFVAAGIIPTVVYHSVMFCAALFTSDLPMEKLRALAERLYSRKACTEIFEPILSDLQIEHGEALARKGRVEAGRVWVHGYFSFWLAVVVYPVFALLKKVLDIWRAV